MGQMKNIVGIRYKIKSLSFEAAAAWSKSMLERHKDKITLIKIRHFLNGDIVVTMAGENNFMAMQKRELLDNPNITFIPY